MFYFNIYTVFLIKTIHDGEEGGDFVFYFLVGLFSSILILPTSYTAMTNINVYFSSKLW